MKVTIIKQHNVEVFENLAQAYEAEFSAITEKKPNEQGLFELDTVLDEHHFGLLVYLDESPAGFAVIAEHGESQFEICEFYIVPCFRKQHLGKEFAHKIWDVYPGQWQIKQIQGAEYATQFWRQALTHYGDGKYQEDIYQDAYWGKVIRQKFDNSIVTS